MKIPRVSKIELEHDYLTLKLSQGSIALKYGKSQSGIRKLLLRHGIPIRKGIPKNQLGPRHPLWKGDQAHYNSLHARVSRRRGKPKHCEVCDTSSPELRYEWANLTGNYADVNDYKRMCKRCHNKHDGLSRNLPRIRQAQDRAE